MARAMHLLKALNLSRLSKQAGMHHDGGGLYLCVQPPAASWVYRYMIAGRARSMGLGPWPLVTLAEAREKAMDAAKLKINGRDPIEARRAQAGPSGMTFGECAKAYIQSHRAGWRSTVHAGQWETTIAMFAEPIIGNVAVSTIDTPAVMQVLQPMWQVQTETASRLRGRIEAILDWAKTRGYREGENPARWKGHLANLLPARTKVKATRHHEALAYTDLPGFIKELRQHEGVAADALAFLILTAARSGEVTGARWSEIDLTNKLWTVPAARMKAGKEHRVPLSPAALAILSRQSQETEIVFSKRGRALLKGSLHSLAKPLGVTVHGFRSTFRDWASEQTEFPNDAIEMALAHAVGSKVEQAYRRTDMFEKRRALMAEWAAFCGGHK
jgi:integrase